MSTSSFARNCSLEEFFSSDQQRGISVYQDVSLVQIFLLLPVTWWFIKDTPNLDEVILKEYRDAEDEVYVWM